ncbi:MAG TPA: tetratricopeptide repeat protein, partial [Anaerolineae bacterium]
GLHYSIDHSLTMEVAYREVGEPRHRLLHRRVAEAMETVYRPQLDSVAGLIAWHFIEGHAPERAAPYAFRAGKIAAGLAAWQEAVTFYQQALTAETNDTQRVEILTALGEAHSRSGANAQATEVLRSAIALAEAHHRPSETLRLNLAQSLLGQARFAEAIEQARRVLDHGQPENVARAEALWGTILSVEGSDLIGAAGHLQKAETFLQEHRDQIDLALLNQVKFDQGSIAAQQGDLAKAIALYRETLDIADEVGGTTTPWQVLARNNLAYHLNLLGDPTAIGFAREGLKIAQEKGILGFQPYLLSTLGEIALSHQDLDSAEKYFNEGLELAERLAVPERIAGITANLGLVAKERDDTALAIHHLSTALAKADALGVQHLAAQIRLWLVPLLPPGEARLHLTEARAIAETSGRRLLLNEVVRLEQQLGSRS